MYKDGNIDDQGIYNKLNHKAGFIFELKTIKTVFPHNIEHQNKHHTNQTVLECKERILEYKFKMPGEKIKSLEELDSKEIYNIFLLSQSLDIKSKGYWCRKLGVEELDWEAWFSHNFNNKLLPRKVKDFNWKLFHGLINTEKRLKQMRYSDGICKICHTQSIEDIHHLM